MLFLMRAVLEVPLPSRISTELLSTGAPMVGTARGSGGVMSPWLGVGTQRWVGEKGAQI